MNIEVSKETCFIFFVLQAAFQFQDLVTLLSGQGHKFFTLGLQLLIQPRCLATQQLLLLFHALLLVLEQQTITTLFSNFFIRAAYIVQAKRRLKS